MNSFKHNGGALLIIALILLVVLSALSVALFSLSNTSLRVSQNYSKFLEAQDKAVAMANYGLRIIQSYPDKKYPGPATCDSVATCNVINADFPHSGRPTLVWTSGLSGLQFNGASQSDAWWTEHGFSYEGTYSGSGNARVIVQQIGAETNFPYRTTFKIVGYGTDSTGTVRATSVLYHTWRGFRPDPYPNYRQAPINTCAGGCPYGQCCSASGTCSSSQAACEDNMGAYDPAGWTCNEYFVTGLGYDPVTCDNTITKILDIFADTNVLAAEQELEDYYAANGSYPTYVSPAYLSFNFNISYSNPSYDTLYWYPCDQSNATSIAVNLNPSYVGGNNSAVVLFVQGTSGDFNWQCRYGGGSPISINYYPPYCGDASVANGICDCNSCGGAGAH